jgi:hypothetical protein
MLRLILVALAISFIAQSTPVAAQSSCAEWCRANRCSGGMQAGSAPVCMSKCVAACQKRTSKQK